jgi:hypothetical protein
MTVHADWMNPRADLTAVSGNAFAVMGHTIGALRGAGNSDAVIDAYREAAVSGTYENLLVVSMVYSGMIAPDRFEAPEPVVIPDDATDEERERLRFPVVPHPDGNR